MTPGGLDDLPYTGRSESSMVDSPEVLGLGFLEDLVVFPKLGRLIFLVLSGLLWHQEANSFGYPER